MHLIGAALHQVVAQTFNIEHSTPNLEWVPRAGFVRRSELNVECSRFPPLPTQRGQSSARRGAVETAGRFSINMFQTLPARIKMPPSPSQPPSGRLKIYEH
jgi:hypothetical protein